MKVEYIHRLNDPNGCNADDLIRTKTIMMGGVQKKDQNLSFSWFKQEKDLTLLD